MLTRFVRVVNNEQQQIAVKVSSSFLYDKSNIVNNANSHGTAKRGEKTSLTITSSFRKR